MKKYLLAVADPIELPQFLNASFKKELIRFILYETDEFYYFFTGVGMAQTAYRWSLLLTQFDYQFIKGVCFLGSAGSYFEPKESYFLFEITEAYLSDRGRKSNLSYFPKNIQTFSIADASVYKDLEPLIIKTNIQVTKAKAISFFDISLEPLEKFKDLNVDLENLEIGILAFLCSSWKIPWGGYLVLTNKVGEKAHEEWLLNYKKKIQSAFKEKL